VWATQWGAPALSLRILYAQTTMKTAAILLCFAAAPIAMASSSAMFTERAASAQDLARFSAKPAQYVPVSLDANGIAAQLAQASEQQAVALDLPMPDGSTMTFLATPSAVMAPELQQTWAAIRSYRAQSSTEPNTAARITTGPLGLMAMVFSPNQVSVIEPRSFSEAASADYISFDRATTVRESAGFTCKFDRQRGGFLAGNSRNPQLLPAAAPAEFFQALSPLMTVAPRTVTGQTLRTYRLALAATGEYSAFYGGTVAGAAQGIVDAMNRVNEVYQRDFSLRMILVGNNNALVFTNAATDPYTNDDGFAMLTENTATLNSVIGAGNYDIGHVFSTGGGGVAGLGVVCGADKAEGVTGATSPSGDAFWIDYVAHEMGHQWGGDHTFNGTAGACGGGNRGAAAAYEPGSGSTIQAYAGICGAQNLQPNSDPWFHAKSLDEMQSYVSSQSCGTTAPSGNQPPVVNAGTDHTIPARTPFLLTGTSSDPESGPLLHQWEQYDLGTASTAATGDIDNGNRPIFRSFNPTTSPTRLFPKLSAILNPATPSRGESLPTTNRILTFRLTVHDRAVNGGLTIGATNSDDVVLTVQDTGAAFAITSNNTPSSVAGFGSQTLTWNVAGTTAAAFNCANVNIALSLDGGLTFPQTLAASTPNDGSELINLPYTPTNNGRLRVLCAANGFFDINDAPLTIFPELFYSGFE
jgi:hypothetical protein